MQRKKNGRPMKSIHRFATTAYILILGQALIPSSSAQAPSKDAGSDPIVDIGTGQASRPAPHPLMARLSRTSRSHNLLLGDLRWREPPPAKAWSGVRDATTFGPMCHQNDNKQLPHSEDCLQLNV